MDPQDSTQTQNYPSAFERAIARLLSDEGGYVYNPADPGGRICGGSCFALAATMQSVRSAALRKAMGEIFGEYAELDSNVRFAYRRQGQAGF